MCSCSRLCPQLSPIQLWSWAFSRCTCAWAGEVLRAGTPRPQQPPGCLEMFSACVFPKCPPGSMLCAVPLR